MMKNEAIAKKKRPTKARPKGSGNRNHSFPCLCLITKNSIHVFSNLFSGFFKVTPKTLLVTINLGTDAFRGMSLHSTQGYQVLFLHTAQRGSLRTCSE